MTKKKGVYKGEFFPLYTEERFSSRLVFILSCFVFRFLYFGGYRGQAPLLPFIRGNSFPFIPRDVFPLGCLFNLLNFTP